MDAMAQAAAPVTAEDPARALESRVPHLLNVAKNGGKPPRARVDALEELSSVLVSGRRDSELSTAVVTVRA